MDEDVKPKKAHMPVALVAPYESSSESISALTVFVSLSSSSQPHGIAYGQILERYKAAQSRSMSGFRIDGSIRLTSRKSLGVPQAACIGILTELTTRL